MARYRLTQGKQAAQPVFREIHGVFELLDGIVQSDVFLIQQAQIEVDRGHVHPGGQNAPIGVDRPAGIALRLLIDRFGDQRIDLGLAQLARLRLHIFEDRFGQIRQRFLTSEVRRAAADASLFRPGGRFNGGDPGGAQQFERPEHVGVGGI